MNNNFDGDKSSLLKARYDKLRGMMSAISSNVPVVTIASLKEQIIALSQLASAVGITLEMSDLKALIAAKESEIEFNQAKINTELRTQDNKKLTQEQQERAEHDKEIKSIYESFDSFHKNSLKKGKKYNKHFDKALENIEKGLDIDEDTKEALTKTENEIEEEKACWKATVLTRNKAEEEYKYHSTKIKEINNKIVDLEPHYHKEIVTLVYQRKYHDKWLSQAKEKISQCEKRYKLRDEEALKLKKCRYAVEQHKNQDNKEQIQHNKDFITKREEYFYKIYGVHSEKVAEEAIKKDTDQIRNSLIENSKNNKKKGDSKWKTIDKTKANDKAKSNQQWTI